MARSIGLHDRGGLTPVSLRSKAILLALGVYFALSTSLAFAQTERIKAGRLRVEVDRIVNWPPAQDLLFPVFMGAPNDGSGRLFFLEKGLSLFPVPPTPPIARNARVRMYDNGALTTFLDLTPEVNADSESGLLGLAFHPGFADPQNPGYRKLYTYHSSFPFPNANVDFAVEGLNVHHHNVLTEWQVSASDPNVVDVNTRREIFRAAHSSDIHNAGTIIFGPDGYLYGSTGTPPTGVTGLLAAQDTSTMVGKIYRIDPLDPNLTQGSDDAISANGQYRIPDDNPFANDAESLGEIFAYGFRNPYRFSVDPVSGLVFVGDVGESFLEELNVVPKGGNLGWPYREGTVSGPVATPPGSHDFVAPIIEYDHDDGTAVVGGHVYHGSIEALQGKYIFGDFSADFFSGHGRLFISDVFDESGVLKDSGEIRAEEILLAQSSCLEDDFGHCSFEVPLMSFGIDADGELYMVGFQPSQAIVHKITNAFYLPEGDYNEDGTVDAADYVVWRDTFGQSVPLGTKADGDGDGIIGQGDYAVWKAHFGESVGGGGSVHNVPGPPTYLRLVQLCVALMVMVRTRRPSQIAREAFAWVRYSLLRCVPVPEYVR